MAITPTNSNTTSIINLPQSQLAVGTDLFLLQTTNGTQTIIFNNLNVVKTDVVGNATVTGRLSGGAATLNSLAVNTLTAANLSTPAGPGISLPPGFYNQFTIQNGLILSASESVLNDPVYIQLYSTDIGNIVQTYLANNGISAIVENFGVAQITPGNTTITINLDKYFQNKPSNISIGSITPAHIYVTTDFQPTTATLAQYNNFTNFNTPTLSSLASLSGFVVPINVTPIVTGVAQTTSSDGSITALSFTVTIGMPQSIAVNVYYRISLNSIIKPTTQ